MEFKAGERNAKTWISGVSDNILVPDHFSTLIPISKEHVYTTNNTINTLKPSSNYTYHMLYVYELNFKFGVVNCYATFILISIGPA